jgi:SAM-dependent methyltransferase
MSFPASKGQDHVFADLEGDRWFERNRSALEHADMRTDTPLMLLDLYGVRPASVLEVGAANGYRLAALHERHGCRTVGLEPSAAAIADGRGRFPGVELIQGQAHHIPLEERFELVILNFVLHWVDRARLLQTVAEVDRVLDDGGLLLIGDFLPASLSRRRYHHLSNVEVYTYKQNYAATFLASGIYHVVALLTGDHSTRSLTAHVADDERVGTWLLRKRLTALYHEADGRGGPAGDRAV